MTRLSTSRTKDMALDVLLRSGVARTVGALTKWLEPSSASPTCRLSETA
jgi:hypothetical protein